MMEYINESFIKEDEMFITDGQEFDFGHFRMEEVSWFNWLRIYGGSSRLVPVVVEEDV